MATQTIESMIENYSDMHKELYGYRPVNIPTDIVELKKFYDDYDKNFQEKEDFIKSINDKAVEDFNSLIDTCIKNGAGDRQTAIRWIIQADERISHNPVEVFYFLYLYGIERPSKELLTEIRNAVGIV